MDAKQDSAGKRRFMPKLRTSFVPMALTVLMVLAVTFVGYLGLQYLRGSTFQEGRSFRVLGEISQQFDSMQGSLASLLTQIPESLLSGCELNPRKVRLYLEKLDLRELTLESTINTAATPSLMAASGAASPYTFTLFLDDPRRPFTVRRDILSSTLSGTAKETKDEKKDEKVVCTMQLRGALQKHLPAFTGQRYFDEVLLVLPNGTVLATLANRDAYALQVPLQEDTSDPVAVADASGLLAQAGAAATQSRFSLGKDAAPAGAEKVTLPQHSVAFTRTIGERSYEISVLPFTPPNSIHIDRNSSDVVGAEPLPTLYLIGMKRENLTQQASDTLGSGGAFAATIIVLLGVLLWPFLSLRMSPHESAIAGFQVFGIMVAFAFLPVVLTSTAVWIWSQKRLEAWADRASETYALQLESAVRKELDEAAWLLHSYTRVGREPGKARSAYLRRDGDRAVTARINRTECVPFSPGCRMFLDGPTDPPRTALRNWSPLRTTLMLRADGRSTAPRISAFGDVPVRLESNLADRKYFQALRAGQQWKPRWASRDTPGFVAQRLFNRADAARVLQVAVSRESADYWKGIITGDTRVYALSATVKPPLLRFAVVDTASGEVLFHSSDERSLTENLLVETERNVRLLQALQIRGGARRSVELTDHFDGKYLGEPHRFYYRSVQNLPWGIVVLYPTESLRDISFDAAIATLAHCLGALVILALVIVVVAFLWNKRIDRTLLAAIWPQWEWRSHYPRIALAMTGFCIAAVIVLLCTLRLGMHWSIALLMLAVAALVTGWSISRSRWKVVRNPGIGTYRLFYSWAAVAVLSVVVVLPTLVVAIGYQDMATGEYIRAQLALAARDIERRELLMQRDLLRWVPNDRDRYRKYPTARTLAGALVVPGYRARPYDDQSRKCDGIARSADHSYCWDVTAFDRLPWIEVKGPGELGWLRRAIWRKVTFGNPQRRSPSTAPRSVVSEDPGGASGGNITLRRRQGVIQAAGQLPGKTANEVRRPCPGEADALPCLIESADVLHRDRWSPINTALLLTTALILIMTWLVTLAARRLFGIRIPFAARFVDPPDKPLPFGKLLATEQRIDQARAEFGSEFTGKDAIDIRRIESGPHYRDVWRSLTSDERHLLHQLARGCFANPENAVVIERLLHRGFLRLRPWPVITDPGLADFARTAPDQEEFQQDQIDWASAEAGSTWHRIRIPLLSGGILIAIGLMTFAGGLMQILLTSLAAISAMLGHVTNLTNFVRKSEPGK